MNIDLRHGDCLDVLKTLPDCSVDAVVTDPPYHLTQVSRGGHARTNNPDSPHGRHRIGDKGFMGKQWDGGDIAHRVELWAECLRVLKPGGHLLSFAATRTHHRMACAIEDAGFEIRDMIAWLYGSGFPKSRNLAGNWQGWGTALKPALEPITFARKPLIGTVAANVLAHGTGALNIDGCRVPSGPDHAEKCASVVGLNSNRNGAVYGEWSGERTDSFNEAGRWPANLIHDGSDEVVALFPDSAGSGGSIPNVKITGYGSGIGTGQSAYFGGERKKVSAGTGSAARFFYCAKASRSDRNEGLTDPGPQFAHGSTLRDAENLGSDRAGNNHPTVKPTNLMRYLCRLVTPPHGVVLDPFMGSGSTGKAAVLEGFNFIGIEREAEYLQIAQARIAAADPGVNAPQQLGLELVA